METQAETQTPTINLWNINNYVIWWLRLTMQRQANTHIHAHPQTPHTHTTHTHISSLQHLHETENLSWNSSFWGQGNVVHILGSATNWRWWENSTSPRSTRLNVDSHLWMLEDWVLSKINAVGLEDWDFLLWVSAFGYSFQYCSSYLVLGYVEILAEKRANAY